MYCIRLQNLPDGSVLKNVFYELQKLHSLGFTNWYSRACELSLIYNIDIHSVENSTYTKNSVKHIVQSQFITDWLTQLSDLNTNPILRTYYKFQNEFRFEPYLTLVNNPKYRIALSKFRTSSHALEIERGRHTNPLTPVDNRLCPMCNILEDELHFLISCAIYENDRCVFFENVSNKYTNFAASSAGDKFNFLLTSEDSQLVTWVGKFIHIAFAKRNNLNLN